MTRKGMFTRRDEIPASSSRFYRDPVVRLHEFQNNAFLRREEKKKETRAGSSDREREKGGGREGGKETSGDPEYHRSCRSAYILRQRGAR